MGYRVAIAAQEERMVTQHFGRATLFHIYEVADGAWTLLESRRNDPACVSDDVSHDSMLSSSVDLVSDCDGVIAARIGPGAVREISARGLDAYAMHAFVEDAVRSLAEELAGTPPTDDSEVSGTSE